MGEKLELALVSFGLDGVELRGAQVLHCPIHLRHIGMLSCKNVRRSRVSHSLPRHEALVIFICWTVRAQDWYRSRTETGLFEILSRANPRPLRGPFATFHEGIVFAYHNSIGRSIN